MRPVWLAVVALLATGAHAEPLTYAAALQRAESSAPDLEAARLKADAARAAVGPSSALPDPKLALGLDNFPISGPPAGRFGADEMTMARVGVMQDMPSQAKRRARQERATADVTAAGAGVDAQARQVRVATAQAWLDLYFGQKRLAAIDELIRSIAPLYAAAPSGVAVGSSRPAQAVEAQALQADLEDRRAELAAKVGAARAQLARWTGVASPDPAGPQPRPEIEADHLRANLANHPRLAVLEAAWSQAQADVRIARAEKRPDWSWDLSYQRRDPRFGDMVSAGVTVSLPVFARSRQDPMISARAAAAAAAGADRQAAARALSAELETALADHTMHHDQFLRARDTLLPLAKRRADLETSSYAAGRADLADVIQAFTGLATAQLTYLDREAQVSTDAVRLNLTYGSDQ